MPLFVEAIFISIAMLLAFFAAFFLIFLLALFLSPIERSLSKFIWDHTTPPAPTPTPVKTTFKDFSRKHNM